MTNPKLNRNNVKSRAKELLADIGDIRGIGFGWDSNGHEALQIDIGPKTDRRVVERRLRELHINLQLRVTSGQVKRD
jgi:hypothetical protein